jgi:peptidyl-prolyl cis-trans isomerase SurA
VTGAWSMRAVTAAALLLMLGGCAIPAWVPLVGKEKEKGPRPTKQTVAAEPEPAKTAAAAFPSLKHEELPDSEDVMDRVVCVVNNDAITLYEVVEAEAHYLSESKEQPPVGEARKELRERLLSNIIENRIQLQQAEREKVAVEDSELTEQLNEIMKKLNAKTLQEFEDILKTQGLTLDGVKKRLRDQIMVQRLTRRKVALRISVTEQEIDRYLAENRAKLETGLSFEAKHILFLPDADKSEASWEAARRKADQVYALLLDGQDFSELARTYSEDAAGKDGGGLGTLKRGELAPDIEETILKLRPGEFSAPFRSQVGYHLFHLDSKETLTGEALVQARSQVREILYRQKYDARLQEWLTEMKQRSIIEVRM